MAQSISQTRHHITQFNYRTLSSSSLRKMSLYRISIIIMYKQQSTSIQNQTSQSYLQFDRRNAIQHFVYERLSQLVQYLYNITEHYTSVPEDFVCVYHMSRISTDTTNSLTPKKQSSNSQSLKTQSSNSPKSLERNDNEFRSHLGNGV